MYWLTQLRFFSRKTFCLAKGPSIKIYKLWRLWFEALSVLLSKIVPVNCWMWRPTQWKGEHFGVGARLWWGLGGNLGSVQTRQSIRQRVTPPSIALHRPWYATAAKQANSKLRSASLRSVTCVTHCFAVLRSLSAVRDWPRAIWVRPLLRSFGEWLRDTFQEHYWLTM